MKVIISVLIVAGLTLPGCFAPINSLYDSAKLIEKGEVEFAAFCSKYYGPSWEGFWGEAIGLENINDNLGVSFRYGLSETMNLSVRYEYLNLKTSIEVFDTEFNDNSMSYLEAGTKIRLKTDKMALQLPVGFYFSENLFFTSIDPRLLYTLPLSKNSEISIIPKAHLFIGDGVSIIPGISLGFGFTNNLNKWAIRPEFGYNGYFSFGLGISFH